MLPEKIKLLNIAIAAKQSGQLVHDSRFEFRYLDAAPEQPSVGLLMPASQLTYMASDLFPVLDQNLPEGDLFMRIRTTARCFWWTGSTSGTTATAAGSRTLPR